MPTASRSADGRMGPSARSSSILFATFSLPRASPIPTFSGMSSCGSAFERKDAAPRPAWQSPFSASRVLSGRVICADCGSIYGPKVWHSNDAYRRIVWQCNNKFNGTKCETPTLDEETIKNAYLKALNILLKDRDVLISNLLLVKEKLLDVNLSKPIEQAKNEMLVVGGLCDQHIFNREKKLKNSQEYMDEYVDLVKRFTTAQDEYGRLIDEQVTRNRKSVKLQAFIDEIKNADTLNLEFNDRLFNLTVLNIKVHKENHLEFNFKDGSVINIEL